MPYYRIPVWHPALDEPLVCEIKTANLGNGQWKAWRPVQYGPDNPPGFRGKTEGEALLALVQYVDLPKMEEG